MHEPPRGGTPRPSPGPTGPVPVAGVRPSAVLVALIAVSAGIELVLWLSDQGWIGSSRWRLDALGYGAFWAGILDDWQPNYPGQRIVMFFSYSLLHADPSHLLGNMVALVWLGPQVIDRMGQAGFALVWAGSVLGGAAAFGLLSASNDPMVGASGGLFGLVGALVILRDFEGRRWTRILFTSVGLMLLNLGMYVIQAGILAWQTHAGGYLIGMAVAAAWIRRKRRRNRKSAAPQPD